MSDDNDIQKLFFELSETGSVHSALYACLELLCQQGECSAGLVVGDYWTSSTVPYASYGPPDELGRLYKASLRNGESNEAKNEGADRYVSVPLSLADRRHGTLWLVRDHGSPWPPDVHRRIAASNTVLALLLVGSDCSVSDPAQQVLSRANFCIQLSQEIARSQRSGSEFSLVLLQLNVPASHLHVSGKYGPSLVTVSLGKWLAKRLRASDAVGLMAPNILGLLLPETGNVGSKIAALRIQDLLPVFTPDESHVHVSIRPEMSSLVARLYPHDGCDAETLVESALAGLSQVSGSQLSFAGTGQLAANS